jgi:hypothetical protein
MAHARSALATNARTTNRIQRANLASKGLSRLPFLSVPLSSESAANTTYQVLARGPAAGQGAVVPADPFFGAGKAHHGLSMLPSPAMRGVEPTA